MINKQTHKETKRESKRSKRAHVSSHAQLRSNTARQAVLAIYVLRAKLRQTPASMPSYQMYFEVTYRGTKIREK